MMSNPQQKSAVIGFIKATILLLIFVFSTAAIAYAYIQYESLTANPVPSQTIQHQSVNEFTIDQLILSQQDPVFRSNLLTVLAAHYDGSDAELNQMLTAYAQYKLKQAQQ